MIIWFSFYQHKLTYSNVKYNVWCRYLLISVDFKYLVLLDVLKYSQPHPAIFDAYRISQFVQSANNTKYFVLFFYQYLYIVFTGFDSHSSHSNYFITHHSLILLSVIPHFQHILPIIFTYRVTFIIQAWPWYQLSTVRIRGMTISN